MLTFLTGRFVRHERHSHLSTAAVLVLGAALLSGLFGLMTALSHDTEMLLLLRFFLVTSVAAVAVVLWNMTSVSVQLREKQYRTLRLLGYSRWGIVFLVLRESLLVGLIAGVVGAASGPLAYLAIKAILASADLPVSDQASPQWFLAAAIAVAGTVVLSLISGVKAASTVVAGKSVQVARKPLTLRGRLFISVVGFIGLGALAWVAMRLAALENYAQDIQPVLLACILLAFVAPFMLMVLTGTLRLLRSVLHRWGPVHLAVAREHMRPQGKLSALAALGMMLIFGFTTIFDSLEYTTRAELAQTMPAATILATTETQPLSPSEHQAVCSASPALCAQTITLTEPRDEDVTAHATTSTFHAWFGDNPAAQRAIPATAGVTSGDINSDVYTYLPWNRLSTTPATSPVVGTYIRVEQPPASLPAGVKAFTVQEWANTLPVTYIVHGGAGSRHLLPMFSMILLVISAFVFSGSYVRGQSLKADNRNLTRLGMSPVGVTSTMVVMSVLPAVAALVPVYAATWVLSRALVTGLEGMGYLHAYTPIPWTLLVVSSLVVMAMFLTPPLVRAVKGSASQPA